MQHCLYDWKGIIEVLREKLGLWAQESHID